MGLLSTEKTDWPPIDLGDGIVFGPDKTVMMAGPCAVESRDQIFQAAEFIAGLGIRVFRAGAFKPRTSPYSFQGLDHEGLALLAEVRERFGLKIITEAKDMTHAEAVAEVADIVQVGAKSMYNHALLKFCGRLDKPVLLKRFFAATLKEFLQMADFILLEGNRRLLLCERGIRTFEPQTRFSLDLSGAAVLQEQSRLPLVLDPSHAIGYRFGVPRLARACAAFGAEGLLIEVHPNVEQAQCDRDQALDHATFARLFAELREICALQGRELV